MNCKTCGNLIKEINGNYMRCFVCQATNKVEDEKKDKPKTTRKKRAEVVPKSTSTKKKVRSTRKKAKV